MRLSLTIGPATDPVTLQEAKDQIAYTDPASAPQTMDSADYQVNGADPALICPAPGRPWPSTFNGLCVVQIDFTAGYGNASDVPEPIRHAILDMVVQMFEERTGRAVSREQVDGVMSVACTSRGGITSVDALLADYRVHTF